MTSRWWYAAIADTILRPSGRPRSDAISENTVHVHCHSAISGGPRHSPGSSAPDTCLGWQFAESLGVRQRLCAFGTDKDEDGGLPALSPFDGAQDSADRVGTLVHARGVFQP